MGIISWGGRELRAGFENRNGVIWSVLKRFYLFAGSRSAGIEQRHSEKVCWGPLIVPRWQRCLTGASSGGGEERPASGAAFKAQGTGLKLRRPRIRRKPRRQVSWKRGQWSIDK